MDGAVASGEAAVDQQALTGESRPVDKAAGDAAFANTLVVSGDLHIAAEKTGSDTAAAQIAVILANAAQNQLEVAARSERMADQLVAPVLTAGGVAFATVGFSGGVAVLNSSFGGNMLLIGPLSMLTYLNLASEQGVLIKDGRSLEKLAEVDVVVFDKTGTLTLEEPEVVRIHAAFPWREQAVLEFAALAEHRQTHPVARAILTAAQAQGIEPAAPDAAAYAMGMGVSVRAGDQEIHVGSARFMTASNVDLPEAAAAWREESEATGGALVFVAVDGRCAGAVALQAQVRPEAAALVARLNARGVETYILSGDARAPTEHLGQVLGVKGVFAEVLPEDKADRVAELQAQGRKVCFVGDRINDALALRQADVSISMRGATTLATDNAQIVLMSPSLAPIDALFDLGRDFRKTLKTALGLCYVSGGSIIGGVLAFGLGFGASMGIYCVTLAACVAAAVTPKRKRGQPLAIAEGEEVHRLPAAALEAPPHEPAAQSAKSLRLAS